MKKPFIFHPLFFGLFPILYFYALNGWLFSTAGFLVALVMVIALTLFLLFLSSVVLKNYVKGAAVTSIFLTIFFLFGPFNEVLNSPTGLMLPYHVPFWVITAFLLGIFLVSAFFIIRTRRKLDVFTRFLNVSSSVLVLLALGNIAYLEFNEWQLYRERKIDTSGFIKQPLKIVEAPDIYHILLDAYGSNEVFKREFGYDNSDFTDTLKERGFYVADPGMSNYAWTSLTVPAMLNMRYYNDFPEDLRGEGAERIISQLVAPLIENNKVLLYLKDRGYTYVHFDSDYGFTARNRNADVYYSAKTKPSNFIAELVEQTLLAVLPWQYKGTSFNRYQKIKFNFEKLKEVPDLPLAKPKYALAHFEMPHEPFVFDESCNQVKDVVFSKEAYIGQLKCTNKKTLDAVDAILAKSEKPPIIIVHGDHGPEPKFFGENPLSEKVMKGRMGILLAMYFPEGGKETLYPTITPVNVYRKLLNYYFGEEFPLLPDESRYSTDTERFKFYDVAP